MKISNGVEMLEVSTNIFGSENIIYPTLIWNDEEVILVDAGYPEQLIKIREAFEKAGVAFDKLSRVIVTHHDIDHIGSISSILKERQGGVKVLAHEDERPYIEGELLPLKVAGLEANYNLLPENMRVIYEKLKSAFQNCKFNVDELLKDGDELPFCGGIKVIFTPGHTVGHICLYLKQNKVLIAGDLLCVKDNKLVRMDSSINFDPDLSIKSIKKLIEYDIETVICYHGGIYNQNANQRIAELLKEREV
jgi:glyoxylase-like metal-dependent hydrolase (beta-lactamase superfamily II)